MLDATQSIDNQRNCLSHAITPAVLKVSLLIGVALTVLGAIGFSKRGFTEIFKQSKTVRDLTFATGIVITVPGTITLFILTSREFFKDRSTYRETTTYVCFDEREKSMVETFASANSTEQNEIVLQVMNSELLPINNIKQRMVLTEFLNLESQKLLEKCELFLSPWNFTAPSDEKEVIQLHIETIRDSRNFFSTISPNTAELDNYLGKFQQYKNSAVIVSPILDK